MRFMRSLFLVSLLTASSFALNLQYGGGIDIGVQKAWLDSGAVETPFIGINVPVFITEEHGVQLSIRYSPKGYELTSGINYQSDWLQYLDIPLCYIYYPEFLPIDLGLNLGFSYSMLLGVSSKEPDGLETSPDKAYYKKSDYGFLVGVHYKRPITYGSLVFSLEYYGGLSTVRDFWQYTYTSEIRPVKNHAVSFCIGFDLPKFGLGNISGGSSGSSKSDANEAEQE
jgi:hypothetical protein